MRTALMTLLLLAGCATVRPISVLRVVPDCPASVPVPPHMVGPPTAKNIGALEIAVEIAREKERERGDCWRDAWRDAAMGAR